ncbi:MAG: T9SS type A sorting domain-containing protein [Flavobacteriales bacterium]|nr:T9SS type A sorting domain-containing protein [Flavobacteriales bacterium]MCB9167741.1 T9SS type A sorting domain-containing protein [Flavobacteriales bacterium]
MRTAHSLLLAMVFGSANLQAQTGASCDQAVPVGTGVHTAPADDYWYLFTVQATGEYTASTCGLSSCDTKLWAYDHCTGLVVNEQGLNALAYNDDACNLQSTITMDLSAGQEIYIRVGDYQNACAGDTVIWELTANLPPPPPLCAANEVPVQVNIVPDNYPNEISWDLTLADGTVIMSGGSSGQSTCVDTSQCIVFTIHDTYGDGIFAPGGYWIYYDGQFVAHGYNYGHEDRVEMHCPPGFSCGTGDPVVEGQHTAPNADYWYTFVPAVNGLYLITTCGLANCDTRLWVYDHCTDLIWDQTNIGTLNYDDNGGGCGPQAQVHAMLQAGQTYYIRVGDSGGACGGMPIDWSITYEGPISGCTDPTACNYDPLASLDDGSCIPWGSPDCTMGPDLIVLSNDLQNSIYASTMVVNANDCYISEGCLSGYGSRDLVRFTTHIQNIGTTDYFIGNPTDNPDQFVWGPCHNHWHYQGYAEYLLYDSTGQQLAQGFKNGFCVLDLECSNGGSAQFGCANMGISMGCGDIYGSGLACQWIDVTGVPDGRYTLVVRTNWDGDPDALGRYELDHNNNWAQACIQISHTPNITVALDPNCTPYVDCLGEIYGSAQFDCEGVCAGTRLIGDLDMDQDNDFVDAQAYVDGILDGSLQVAPCTDTDNDGELTVTDVSNVAHCQLAQIGGDPQEIDDLCTFPVLAFTDIFDTVTFTIGHLDPVQQYLDVYIRNPNRKQIGYEFTMSGLTITGVDNLYNNLAYPITPAFNAVSSHIMGVSFVDSLIDRNNVFVPLCRIHYLSPAPTICIDQVIDVVNEDHHAPLTFLEDACIAITGLAARSRDSGVSVYPDPFRNTAWFVYPPVPGGTIDVEMTDVQGRIVRTHHGPADGQFTMDGSSLAPGTYLYRVKGSVTAEGRLVHER